MQELADGQSRCIAYYNKDVREGWSLHLDARGDGEGRVDFAARCINGGGWISCMTVSYVCFIMFQVKMADVRTW